MAACVLLWKACAMLFLLHHIVPGLFTQSLNASIVHVQFRTTPVALLVK